MDERQVKIKLREKEIELWTQWKVTAIKKRDEAQREIDRLVSEIAAKEDEIVELQKRPYAAPKRS